MLSSRFTIFLFFLLASLWDGGCASSPPQSSVGIAGGGSVSLERSGAGFKQAANDRVGVSDASLQAVNFDGHYYVRWTFAIRPKLATELTNIRIEDVSGASPLLLVNDVAPQQVAGIWRERRPHGGFVSGRQLAAGSQRDCASVQIHNQRTKWSELRLISRYAAITCYQGNNSQNGRPIAGECQISSARSVLNVADVFFT